MQDIFLHPKKEQLLTNATICSSNTNAEGSSPDYTRPHLDTTECGKFGLHITLEKKSKKHSQRANQNAEPRPTNSGTQCAVPELSSGMPNYALDLEVHRMSTQKILEESKSPSISGAGWPPLLQAIVWPSTSSHEPWAQAGNQNGVLDDIAWENFSRTVEATKVCASKRLSSQTTSTQGALPITS